MILLNNLKEVSGLEKHLNMFIDTESQFYSLFYDRFQRAIQTQKRILTKDEIQQIADSVGIEINW